MTYEQAGQVHRPAYCFLETGGVLRYDPGADRVLHLSYPAQPSAWKEAVTFPGDIPKDGWRHLAGCQCDLCAPKDSLP
jgi:hypothetical protein